MDVKHSIPVPNTDKYFEQILGPLVGTNDLILDRIFSFLRFEDLKSCRLVNSQWLDISQSYYNKQSVILIEYGTSELVKSAHDFLSSFQDPPLSLLFTGVIIKFHGCLSFKWENDGILDFLKEYGNQLTYLKIKVFCGIIITDLTFFAFKKILSELTPELQHLSVDIQFCDITSLTGEVSSTIEYKTLETAVDFKLPKLRKLEWSTVSDGWWDYPSQRVFQKIFTPPFMDLLKSAPNLSSVLTEGSSFNSEAFDHIPEERISRIKEISVSPKTSLHQLHTFLNKLTELSLRNLKLTSFNILACDVEESWPLWKQAVFVSLLTFLDTQKDCLQKLNIRVPMCGSPFKYNSLPQFPKMTKLKFLYINCSRSFLKTLLGESNWNALFPDLQKLHLSYDYSASVMSYDYIGLLKLIFGHTVNKTVKHVRLHPKSNADSDKAFLQSDGKLLNLYYEFIKNVFLSMQTFELIDNKMGMHFFNCAKNYNVLEK